MSKKPLAVVILAAGKGKRMNSDKPKVMHELAGLPMINWLLKSVEALSPERIVVVTGPDMPDLEAAAEPHITAQQPVQNGTGGAVMAAFPALDDFYGDVMILLGDTPLISPETMRALVAARHEGGAGISVLGMRLANPAGYGRLIVDNRGELLRIVEDKDADARERAVDLVNTGAFCVDGSKLGRWLKQIDNNNAQKEYYITDLPELALRDHVATRVCTAGSEEELSGCNTRIDLALMEARLQDRMRQDFLLSGVSMSDPATVYFHHDTKIEPDVHIEPSVFFGAGVKVASGAHIKAFCHLEGARIGKNVTIGPFARLRPGTSIGDDVRIGNFVEVKKSDIAKGSKINHLAYVGDTIMGENVNFSAGAITVNYDGFQKHKTVIGKDVMVGSNANLVAPLKIDDGAFIAAGSTITVDVPADALTISRDVAKIRKGWALEYRKRKNSKGKK